MAARFLALFASSLLWALAAEADSEPGPKPEAAAEPEPEATDSEAREGEKATDLGPPAATEKERES